MYIKLLVIQRKGHPTTHYLPEVLAVADEVTLEENPDWWETEKAKQIELLEGDYDAVAEVVVHLNENKIYAALFPEQPVLWGNVAPPKWWTQEDSAGEDGDG